MISAVGHETDVTIADFAADLRAPTPSAAAELAVFDYRQFCRDLSRFCTLLETGMTRRLQAEKNRLEKYSLRLRGKDPLRQIQSHRQHLADLEEDLRKAMGQQIKANRHRLALDAGRLQSLSPLEKISRGFGCLTDENGRRLVSINQINPGDRIRIQVRDGKIEARAEKVEETIQGWK